MTKQPKKSLKGANNQLVPERIGNGENIDFQNKYKNQRGAALLIALIVITAFVFIVAAGTRTVAGISSEAKKIEQARQDTARAEYYLSMAEATLKYDVRRKYNEYQASGKQKELQYRGDGKLPMFDSLTVSASKPLLNIDGSRTGESPATSTSLYGNTSLWTEAGISDSRTYILNKSQEKQIVAPDGVEILSFREAYRRSMAETTEPIYAFTYTVRSRAGEFAEIVREGTILLGPTLGEDAPPTCADLLLTGSANPANVAWGNSTTLNLTFEKADGVAIYNNGGATLFSQAVANQAAPQTISYNTGALTGPSNFVGEASRGGCQIQVPITVGVAFNQNLSYTANGAQTVNIIEGDQVRYDWGVTNADSSYTMSWITYGGDPTRYYGNVYGNSIVVPGPSQSTTSTLHVIDSRVSGGAEQTVTVNINVCLRPKVISFSGSPASVTQGGNQNIQFDWQTQDASAVRIIRLSDSAVVYAGNQANGSIQITQPQTTTQYRLEAISACGAPATASPSDATITVQPPLPPVCQPPVINGYTLNPSSVIQGGNQTITFNWNVSSGCPVTVSIDNGVGGGLPASGTASANQPQTTTTYTLTASNSGGSVSQSHPVTASAVPSPLTQSCTTNDFNTSLQNPDSFVYVFQPSTSVAVQRNLVNPFVLDVSINWSGLSYRSPGNASLTSYGAVIDIPGANSINIQASGEGGITHSFAPPGSYIASTQEARSGGMSITIPYDGRPLSVITINGSFGGLAYAAGGGEELPMSGSFGGTSNCP